MRFKRKGGGGQRPFEQCSKKLHFSLMSASLCDGHIVFDFSNYCPYAFEPFPRRCYVAMCSLGSEGVIASPREVDSRLDVAFY